MLTVCPSLWLSPAQCSVCSFKEYLLLPPVFQAQELLKWFNKIINTKHLPECLAHSKPSACASFSEEACGFAPSTHWHSSARHLAQGLEEKEAT